MGLEAGLKDCEGLGISDVLWEGVPDRGAALEKTLSSKLQRLDVVMKRRLAEED